jgi:hypothetical protein
MTILKLPLAGASMLLLCGCASLTTGQNQSVSVDTGNEAGATCTLTNDKGTWHVPSTPSSVVVNRAYGDLKVSCRKGNQFGETTVASSTKGMAFGNILAGGLVGAAVDCGTGSAYDYPNQITVPLAYQP